MQALLHRIVREVRQRKPYASVLALTVERGPWGRVEIQKLLHGHTTFLQKFLHWVEAELLRGRGERVTGKRERLGS